MNVPRIQQRKFAYLGKFLMLLGYKFFVVKHEIGALPTNMIHSIKILVISNMLISVIRYTLDFYDSIFDDAYQPTRKRKLA